MSFNAFQTLTWKTVPRNAGRPAMHFSRPALLYPFAKDVRQRLVSFFKRMIVNFRRRTHASVASKMTHSKPIQTTIPFTWVFGKTLAKYLPRFFEVITISPFETKVIRHCSWINNCTSGFYSEFSATGIMACITTWYHWYTSNRTK